VLRTLSLFLTLSYTCAISLTGSHSHSSLYYLSSPLFPCLLLSLLPLLFVSIFLFLYIFMNTFLCIRTHYLHLLLTPHSSLLTPRSTARIHPTPPHHTIVISLILNHYLTLSGTGPSNAHVTRCQHYRK
jgi:hypothetical protein